MRYPHTLDAIARDLGAPREDIVAIAGLIADAPELYDAGTETVSDTGQKVIAAQVAADRGEPGGEGLTVGQRVVNDLGTRGAISAITADEIKVEWDKGGIGTYTINPTSPAQSPATELYPIG